MREAVDLGVAVDGRAGKPSVEIAMALYEPNRIWLEEQLCSLNAQTYPNVRLLVWNDGPPSSENNRRRSVCSAMR